MHNQRRILHALPKFKTIRFFRRAARDCFVDVSRHRKENIRKGYEKLAKKAENTISQAIYDHG
jgi:hypothetical protein|tara:strand:- start:2859 stop:3047 length:189 start_codon:yes stop_codon:yes gene_type:complete